MGLNIAYCLNFFDKISKPCVEITAIVINAGISDKNGYKPNFKALSSPNSMLSHAMPHVYSVAVEAAALTQRIRNEREYANSVDPT